ncbi:MAG: alpha/beta fold hydrolase [Thermodesulfobacteriota bacterium]
MPLIPESSYRAPLCFRNGHIQTVCASLFRKVPGARYRRRRIQTPDGDFLDLDVSSTGATKAAVVLHGLEGDSERAYVRGMVRALNRAGWDAVAMNFRGCSGEINRRLRFYHSGSTDDLDTVVSHLIAERSYSDLALVGFSLGGNVVLRYLGERGPDVPERIRGAVAFSVPCELVTGAKVFEAPANTLYLKRFLRMLRGKIREKTRLFPQLITDEGFETIKNFKDFDDRYTAPIHGFLDAEDYWRQTSSKPLLDRISVPTLLVNAADDPFLSPECYPAAEAEQNPSFFLEIPRNGGHVGFVAFQPSGEYWSESRAASMLNNLRR